MSLLQSAWPLEKNLSCNSKEFRRILRSINIEHSIVFIWNALPQSLEFVCHDCRPRQVIRSSLQIRRAVGCAILEIQLMRKFMEHDVHSIRWITRTEHRGIPCNYQGAKIVRGVPYPIFRAFLPESAAQIA